MQFSRVLFLVAAIASPLCLVATTWLYFYPLFHSCGFPVPTPSSPRNVSSAHSLSSLAPFRLLALGDPQLEGDSSLPKPDALAFPSLEFLVQDLRYSGSWKRWWYLLRTSVRDAVKKDTPKLLEGYRKRIDLWGNDYYLAHIVRQLRWWTQPSHVSVLGDLLGSQWVSDEEFERRAERYWGRVMRGMENVGPETMGKLKEWEKQDDEEMGSEEDGENGQEGKEEHNEIAEKRWGGTREVLGADPSWSNRVINIAGNHDIGYAGDIDEHRIARFERAFGKANWDIIFTLPRSTADNTSQSSHADGFEPPALRLIILNDMNLDTPAFSSELQTETYEFMNHIISTSRPVTDKTHATILLTHIPLHKEPGICVDSPFFDFFDSGHGVKEQNMLSDYSSRMVLESIFGLSGNPEAEGKGLGRRGIVLNGHDHEGCDVLHYVSREEHACLQEELPSDMTEEWEQEYWGNKTSEEAKWHVKRLAKGDVISSRSTKGPMCKEETPHLREITLRSMMGDFSGYAGFLSAWFDEGLGEKGEWRIEFTTCGVGVQHWWWGVHIADLILVVLLVTAALASIVERVGKPKASGRPKATVDEKKAARPMGQGGNKANTMNGSIRKQKGKT